MGPVYLIALTPPATDECTVRDLVCFKHWTLKLKV